MTDGYPKQIVDYLADLYSPDRRQYACCATNADEFEKWQTEARPAFRTLIGLDRMADELSGHTVTVDLDDAEDLGGYTRQRGTLHTEPSYDLPFWLLRPKGESPFPLAVTPHGHDPKGMDEYTCNTTDEAKLKHIHDEDRDVAVQAVERGFLTIAPATRGIAEGGIGDVFNRHGGRDCLCHLMHALVAGRTSIGERVWDMEHVIDYAIARNDVDPTNVLMMGNSGGGMVTTYAAACIEKITIAIASCSFSTYVRADGKLSHCDCNVIPGILRFGEFYDVAGLIAPRAFMSVHGKLDALHTQEQVDFATGKLAAIYAAAGVKGSYERFWGDGGHRFYKHAMWPFVEKHMQHSRR